MNEKSAWSLPGIPTLLLFALGFFVAFVLFINGANARSPGGPVAGIVLFGLLGFLSKGLFPGPAQPGQGDAAVRPLHRHGTP